MRDRRDERLLVPHRSSGCRAALTFSQAKTESQRQNPSFDSGVPCVVIANFRINLGMTLFEPVRDSGADIHANAIRASRFQNGRGPNQAVRAYDAPPEVAGRQTVPRAMLGLVTPLLGNLETLERMVVGGNKRRCQAAFSAVKGVANELLTGFKLSSSA